MTRADASPCPECGVENAADHNFCKSCGFALKNVPVDGALAGNLAERNRDRCLKLIKAYPDNANAHFNLGLAFYHLGQAGNAQRAFERVIELDETYSAAHFHLALCHYRRGAMTECVAAARRAIQYNPSSAPAHFRVAIALFHLGRLDEAEDAFRNTIMAPRR